MAFYIITVELLVDNSIIFRNVGVTASEQAGEEELYEALLQTEMGYFSPSILDWYKEY